MARILLAPHPMKRVPNSQHDRDNAPCIHGVFFSPLPALLYRQTSAGYQMEILRDWGDNLMTSWFGAIAGFV